MIRVTAFNPVTTARIVGKLKEEVLPVLSIHLVGRGLLVRPQGSTDLLLALAALHKMMLGRLGGPVKCSSSNGGVPRGSVVPQSAQQPNMHTQQQSEPRRVSSPTQYIQYHS